MLQIQAPSIDLQQAHPVTRMARFRLKYDHSKAKAGGMTRFQMHHAEGIRFSSGRVSLDFENGNGTGYLSMNAMVAALTKQGAYQIEWVD